MQEMQELYEEALRAMTELCESAQIGPGDLVVVGCSTSEIQGARIGTSGTLEVARAALQGLLEPVQARGGVLAVQCCEHLNRALVLPRSAIKENRLTEVCAEPWEHAGGSMATAYYQALEEPALAETIAAKAGLDIGDTLIGMHLARGGARAPCAEDHRQRAPVRGQDPAGAHRRRARALPAEDPLTAGLLIFPRPS